MVARSIGPEGTEHLFDPPGPLSSDLLRSRKWVREVGTRNSEEPTMSLPRIASRDEWLDARKELMAKEKEMTRQRDALNIDRRDLPMVEVERDYVLDGPDGKATLLDVF
jgi:hypothetical protein